MQTPTEIYLRWQPEPNSKMSHWIDTLYSLEIEVAQLEDIRQQRIEEREIATKKIGSYPATAGQEPDQFLLNNLVLLDRVIARTDDEIAKLRAREYKLEQILNAASERLAASKECVEVQLYNTLQSRQLETFNSASWAILQDGVTELLENQRRCNGCHY